MLQNVSLTHGLDDGGMLILLSFLLKQHKVWANCTTRVFTVAQMSDNSVLLKKNVEMYLYDLRIDAQVFVAEMNDQDISAYTVEMTLDMQNRIRMLKHITAGGLSETRAKETDGQGSKNGQGLKNRDRASAAHNTGASARGRSTSPHDGRGSLKETESALNINQSQQRPPTLPLPHGHYKSSIETEVDQDKLKRMHTAVKLNEAIRMQSSSADLVIVNFPTPPERYDGQHCYMEYLDVLSSGVPRVVMVRGSGMEVVTIYS